MGVQRAASPTAKAKGRALVLSAASSSKPVHSGLASSTSSCQRSARLQYRYPEKHTWVRSTLSSEADRPARTALQAPAQAGRPAGRSPAAQGSTPRLSPAPLPAGKEAPARGPPSGSLLADPGPARPRAHRRCPARC